MPVIPGGSQSIIALSEKKEERRRKKRRRRKGMGGDQLYFRCASPATKRKQLSLLTESRMREGREKGR